MRLLISVHPQHGVLQAHALESGSFHDLPLYVHAFCDGEREGVVVETFERQTGEAVEYVDGDDPEAAWHRATITGFMTTDGRIVEYTLRDENGAKLYRAPDRVRTPE